VDSRKYRFPWPDGHFDFVVLTSVFTHVLKDAAENYLREIARVLEPGGTMFATAFLLSKESELRTKQNVAAPRFPFSVGGAKVGNKKDPEGSVAFDQKVFLQMVERCGLTIERFEPGYWSGPIPDTKGTYQDLLIARKK